MISCSKCLPSRTNHIQCQRQPGRDRESLPAVQLQHAALSDGRDWWVNKDGFSWGPVRCRPWPEKQVGAIPALCGWQPSQLLLSGCEWKLIYASVVVSVTNGYLFWFPPPQTPSTPPECLVRCFSLLTGVLAGYVSTGFLTEEEACRSQLFTKAKVSPRCLNMQYIHRVIHLVINHPTSVTLHKTYKNWRLLCVLIPRLWPRTSAVSYLVWRWRWKRKGPWALWDPSWSSALSQPAGKTRWPKPPSRLYA